MPAIKKRFWTILAGLWLVQAMGLAKPIPRYDHVVIVMEENHSYDNVLAKGKEKCPYINLLARTQALMTQSYAVSHPSLPNYLAIFSGSTQGVGDDGCEYAFSGTQLADQLVKAGFTFAGYSEDLPAQGATICNAGGANGYYKKHCPWAYWQANNSFPVSLSLPFKDFPQGPNCSSLPTVCFVIPNEAHDMHEPNGHPPAADQWLQKRLGGYLRWAKNHNSLLIVTWDEDDWGSGNQIPTIFAGARIKPGKYPQRINHYSVLRTIEDMYGLELLGESKNAEPIRDIFE